MKRFLTLDEVAELFRVHRGTVYKWVRSGKLRAIRVAATWRIPQDVIDELVGQSRSDT
jgi:excisionase family DNA binding protein